MRRAAILMIALALVAACDDDNPAGPSNTGPIIFTAQLSAQNEVPAIQGTEANGRGAATITFNVPRDGSGNASGGGSATFAIQLSGFPAGTTAHLAHIHPGAAGVNGGVLVSTGLSAASPIVLTDGTATATLTQSNLTQDQANQVLANPQNFYFNVHTPTNPGGVVRGQLTRIQ